jgi:hypothetical protein
LTASPDVAETDIALNAIADESTIRSKLIPGLGVEADTAPELGVTPPANSSRVASSINGTGSMPNVVVDAAP